MYLKTRVKIPDSTVGISRKTIHGTTYVYYTYRRGYSKEKKYTEGKDTTIGKCDPSDESMMFPNNNFLKFFPDAVPQDETPPERSACLRVGSFAVIRRIIREYHLDDLAERIFGRNAGLFLDLAAYTIVTEGNVAQYYPEYAYNHPLLTTGMHVYSDSSVGSFLKGITQDRIIRFQNTWNDRRDHREKIYISYDSTNKNCQAGDIEFAEFGHPKEDNGKPVFNYSIAYDDTNSIPLYYEEYPGSIVDISQLQVMLEKAKDYGYHQIGFILDRGYFSRENIRYMDRCGYAFIIMMKGMKPLVHDIVAEVRGKFENDRKYSLRRYKLNGYTIHQKLFASDAQDRYFHIYYSDRRKAAEREEIEDRVDKLAAYLKKQEGKQAVFDFSYSHYFDLIYSGQEGKDQRFIGAAERTEVINEEIGSCGYFVIITSEKMTAEQALDLYKSRDVSEKLFRSDKSFLGNKTMRSHMSETLDARIFVEFVALIIRNRIYTLLKDQEKKNGQKENYMSVTAAIRELEKIEVIKGVKGDYRQSYALTATQKTILRAFGITEADIRKMVQEINSELEDQKQLSEEAGAAG